MPYRAGSISLGASPLDDINKVTLAATLVGASLVGAGAFTTSSGSPPGGLALAFLAFLVMKFGADQMED